MRTIYGILVVSLLLFLAGVILFVLAFRTIRRPEPGAPVASVKQVMQGIVAPSAKAIYDAVSTVVTSAGTTETVPRSDRDWEIVGSHATALAEAANLLQMGNRPRDSSDWPRLSNEMAKAAMQAYRAAEKQDADALLSAGEVLNSACENCHRNYDVPID
jgi:hypothetical protein